MVIRFAKEDELERINVLRKQVNDLHVEGKPDVFKPGFNEELQNYVYYIFTDPAQKIVVADTDVAAQGAVTALRAMAEEKSENAANAKVLSMNAWSGDAFALLQAQDPRYLACLDEDPWVMAATILQSAIDYYEGRECAEETNIAIRMVDASTVGGFLPVPLPETAKPDSAETAESSSGETADSTSTESADSTSAENRDSDS